MGGIISKINLTHLLITIALALVILTTYYKGEAIKYKEMSYLKQQNFEQALKLQKATDSMRVVYLRFQKDKELNNYIEQNSTLKKLLEKQGFDKARDYNKLNAMLIATQKYVDSTISSFKTTKLVENIKTDKNGVVPFSKKGKCISYDGTLEYKDGDLFVNTFNEKFTGNILLTNSKGKRTKKFLFFRYGPRENIFTTTSDCGNVNIQVIEKQK